MSETSGNGAVISRKNLLRGVAATTLLTVLGVGGKVAYDNATQPTEPKLEGSLPRDLLTQIKGVQVYGAAATGLPYSWEDAAQATGKLDTQAMQATLAQAQQQGEVRVAAVEPVTTTDSIYKEMPPHIAEKPRFTELPADVVTSEELTERGVTIIGGDITSLSLRQSAFEPGGILERYSKGGGRKLVIAITDLPEISQTAYADPRYDRIRNSISHLASPEHRRDILDSRIRGLEQRLERALDYEKNAIRSNIMALKALDDEAIIRHGLMGGVAGYYLPAGHEAGEVDTNTILIAVGPRPQRLDFLSVTAGYSNQDYLPEIYSTDVKEQLGGLFPSLGLHPNQTYPRQSEFRPAPPLNFGEKLSAAFDPEYYRPPGFVLRHELVHDELTAQYGWGEQASHETNVDLGGMGHIIAAEQLLDSGDNSGYSLVFKRNDSPEYILT